MRLAQALQPSLANAISQPEKSRLHIHGKSSDFLGNRFVQDFNLPAHILLYLNFEINNRCITHDIPSTRPAAFASPPNPGGRP